MRTLERRMAFLGWAARERNGRVSVRRRVSRSMLMEICLVMMSFDVGEIGLMYIRNWSSGHDAMRV